jgi:hypothetical protein
MIKVLLEIEYISGHGESYGTSCPGNIGTEYGSKANQK